MDAAIDDDTFIARTAAFPSEDERLLEAARDGDRRAFESLYRQHVGRVYAICLRLTANVQSAEDLTQEAFIRAWHRLAGFRGDSAFATWLYRLTVNVVLDQQRAQRPWFRRVVAIDDTTEVVPAPVVCNADQHDLESAIRKLPPAARTVFVLHDVEGWQHDEIAARTGTAVGTSKAHLHRARRLLKEWLSL